MDIRSLSATSGYAAARPATKIDPEHTATSPTARIKASFEEFNNTLQQSEQTSVTAMTGNGDPHALVQALAQTELAVETAVTVRNKVVEAYQEILRMPV
ncbi:flagellar hook-basal body complex protein FliE [Phaeobacter italicus]|jgi:flagellar hook-basal body complex protein FliE|uniref:Flagellar hook-basal body complex protein FliE n=1 Tax=Phaeobacter italicus TaxID=481446 RepID=A0A0H5D5T0_9RHOB|nr:flagellar hook-basal body complex protein FliE [Phaeobacter italicus]EEB69816.1 flagellar hook-basal body complex protein FliE, putative [Ruegeria sp. R11]MEC8016674.1 flagellar hook-basal body complex protein FliE [Pseudomonadota bacterium]MBO9443040.1 flagellar hook-basal body complex protein FliE [Phaeobacter italicus]MBY5977701.1 flagellar hook-basal body complex protein FliE [Phaeobacter italicus]MBY6045057.1 flagellar hook-basal body complex protein FliE [Phaeobacter italicus]